MSEHELCLLFDSPTLRVEDFRCQGTHAAHADEEAACNHEIAFPRRGTFVRRDSSGTVVADASQALFFHSGQPYHISHPVPGGDCSTLFTLKPSVLWEMLRLHHPAAEARPDRPFPVGHVWIESRQRLLQYHLLWAAFQAEQAEALRVEEQILVLLGQIIARAFHPLRSPTSSVRPGTAGAHRDLVEQVKLVLGAHFREKLLLHHIAAAVNSSPYFMCRVFRQVTGLAVHYYLTRLRLLHALEHLAECPHDDLTTLALGLGFSSHSQFTAAFRREFGLSPRQFRRLRRQLSKNPIV